MAPFIRTSISITGLNSDSAKRNLPDLRDELVKRPWLINPDLIFDQTQNCLMVTVDYEGDDIDVISKAVLDEIWDCVIATFDFVEKIEFKIIDKKRIE